MNKLCWRLLEIFCRALTPSERDAVRGDIAELGESAGRALIDVLGLIVRRQVELWTRWRPWLILAGLVFPLAQAFWLLSRTISDRSVVFILPYVRGWQWHDLSNSVFRQVLFHHALGTALGYCALFCASWSSGFVLGTASRRSRPAHGMSFGLLLLFGGFALASVPSGRPLLETTLHRAVPDAAFYRTVLPFIVRLCLVLIPLAWGMAGSWRIARHRLFIRSMIWILAIANLVVFALQSFVIPTLLTRNPWFFAAPRWALLMSSLLLLRFAVYWPAAYLLITAAQRRQHRTVAATRLSLENTKI